MPFAMIWLLKKILHHPRRESLRCSVLIPAFAGLCASGFGATIIEDFNYASGSNPSTQNGGSGWAGAWASGASPTSTLKIAGTDLSYSSGGYAITQTGTGSLNGTYFAFRGMNRPTPSLTGTLWFSLLVNNATSIEHSGMEFNNPRTSGLDYNASPFMVDLHGGALEVYYGSTSSPTTVATGLTLGTTHLLLGSIDIGAGNDTFSLWADPADLSNLGTALFTGNTQDMGAALTLAGVFGWADSTVSGTYGRVDALRLSDGSGDSAAAYAAVTGISAVPEPGRPILILMALAALVTWRRRQQPASAL